MRYPENAPVPTWLKLRNKLPRLKKIKLSTLAICSTVSLLGLAFYAVGVQPKLNHDYYANIQKENFAKMRNTREDRAHGLRPWSDPFDREK